MTKKDAMKQYFKEIRKEIIEQALDKLLQKDRDKVMLTLDNEDVQAICLILRCLSEDMPGTPRKHKVIKSVKVVHTGKGK